MKTAEVIKMMRKQCMDGGGQRNALYVKMDDSIDFDDNEYLLYNDQNLVPQDCNQLDFVFVEQTIFPEIFETKSFWCPASQRKNFVVVASHLFQVSKKFVADSQQSNFHTQNVYGNH